MFEKLFSPIKIKDMELKNRIILPAMGTKFSGDGSEVTDKLIDYHVARVKGGSGLNIVEVTSVYTPAAPKRFLSLSEDEYIPGMKRLTDAIHAEGGKAGVQLWLGALAVSSDRAAQIIIPSDMPISAEITIPGMPKELIPVVVDAYGKAANRAVQAGYDCIEFHCAHNYLPHSFLSGGINHRTDEYGGSFENRQRFLREIVEEVRKACGKDYPIAIKMTLDSVDDDERPIEEGLAIAKYLADSGLVDMIHFGRGAYSCRWRMVSSVYQPVGFDLDAAPKVREMIGDLPLMAHGKLNHPDVAEKAIADGLIDLVAIGHGLIADPHWANKVKNGKLDDINPCIGCGECHFNAMKGHSRPCAVNVHGMREGEFPLTPAKSDLNILVIGAGPGGMKAAATAAERGYRVSLYEKNTYMGGIMAAAGAPRFKADVHDQVEYLKRQIAKYPVDLHLNTEITLEDVQRLHPDFVVVATGAKPVVIPVPGADKPHVSTAVPVLLKQKEVGQKVVVVGGGEVGCELSSELCLQGKDVIMIELLDDILRTADHFVANDQNIRYLVENSGTDIRCSTRLTEVLDDGIMVINKEGEAEKITCDSVVFASGFKADHSLYNDLLKAGYECVQVGDNVKPGKIINAIHQAYHYIRVLEED